MPPIKEKKRFDIVRTSSGLPQKKRVYVPMESALTLFVNGKELITFLCSPSNLEALAVGFLHTEGFLNSRKDLLSLTADQTQGTVSVEIKNYNPLAEHLTRKRTLTTGCGRGTVFYSVLDSLGIGPIRSRMKVTHQALQELMRALLLGSETYRETGGIHSALLGTKTGEPLILCEDLGRHNAVDKVFGECFLRDIPPTDKVLVTSGRVSSEMLIKALKKRVPVVVSRTSPTSLAVDMARQLGLTVAGYARGDKMNVYTHPERIRLA
ncbi:MAG: formate dehydrogenase accessory sulfurtransferase FdhD [Nitrospinota bacterium]